MSELLDFATRLIELEGGAVESQLHGVAALLPAGLSAAWGTGEELELTEHEDSLDRFSYGTELLERMIQTATQAIPVACLKLELLAPRLSQNAQRRRALGPAQRRGRGRRRARRAARPAVAGRRRDSEW